MKLTIKLTREESDTIMRRARGACPWGRFSMTSGPRARLCVHEHDGEGGWVKGPAYVGLTGLGLGLDHALLAGNAGGAVQRCLTLFGANIAAWDNAAINTVIQFALYGEVRYA